MTQWIGCYQCGSYQEVRADEAPSFMSCGHSILDSYELPEPPKKPHRRGLRYKDKKSV